MGDRLTATDALLACAAAETRAEMLAARTALIRTSGAVLRDVDTSDLVAGDGTAGRELLGGTGHAWADTCAIRSYRLQIRLWADLARADSAADLGEVEVSAVARGLVTVAGLWLIVAGIVIGWTTPPLSGGQLIAMPALAFAGVLLVARAMRPHDGGAR